jgi:cytochrome c556
MCRPVCGLVTAAVGDPKKEDRMRRLAAVVGGGVLVLAAAGAAADKAAIKYRQDVMDAVGGTMGAIVALAKQEVSHADHLALHARNMATLASVAPAVFPAGSGDGDTKALPAIWTRQDVFKERLDAFVAAAQGFDAVVASGDMSGFGAALNSLGQSCKSCHDDFKAK